MTYRRSVVGRPLDELPQVLAPLRSEFEQIDHTDLPKPIQKFIWFQLVDAYRHGLAVMSLASARKSGVDLDPMALEVVTRRVVEQAIVVSFAITDPVGVERFYKTHEHEWVRSFGDPPRDRIAADAKQLPKYIQMAEKADPALGEIWKKLSFLSHPRHSAPYSSIEAEITPKGLSADQFFDVRAMPLVDDLDIAIDHILAAWEKVKPKADE